jgi:D-3-phosphoglycerate dehydrogenase
MLIKPLNQCNILVTPTSFAKYNKDHIFMLENAVKKVTYNTTGKPLSEKDLIPLVAGIDGFIAGLDDITSGVIKAAGNLKVISRYGTGVDRVDLKAANKAGIFVTNTPGANSISVAELTIGLAISAARNIPEGNTRTKNGSWPRFSGTSLSGKTFGIIGLGSIGKEVAKRLSCFNIKILAYDISFDAGFASRYDIIYADIDRILTSSDFISLHIPVFKDTVNIINRKSLAKMKQGAILINTARGELVDEDALYNSLKSGHLRAAALDAFREEPPDPQNKLLSLPQVTAVPHMGAATDDASNEMTRISIEECFAVLRGEMPKHAVAGPGL